MYKSQYRRRNVRGKRDWKGVRQRCLLSPTLFNIYLEVIMKNRFLNTGCVNIGVRRTKCIRFADDMALLAQEERMLKNMPMGLNDRCEDYGINISKTKAMVIARKPKMIDMRIRGNSVEQVGSFKYLECNICSNMNCCQEVKQRISMAKEAFNRKRSIFCGPLEKELRKRLVKFFVWRV